MPHEQWMTRLADDTEIVVAADGNGPSPLGIDKAIAIVQSRFYLEPRAIQLIAPFLKGRGSWRLLTIDFGVEALRHASEFLMCFAFVAANTTLCGTSPYFEVGFALPKQRPLEDPVFLLTVKTIVGIPFPMA
ncbi:hypothetical protein SRS16CHR_01395 [Variovorax sp. SRS16]|nr:hypothetical protein SRS16CHR_01395 [Variovorax sp. SRS16]